MDWLRLLTAIITFGVIVWTIGALVSLVIRFGQSGHGAAVAIVVSLLVVSVLLIGIVGAKGPEWLANPNHYW